jgi:hypothetical protein
MLSTSAPVRCLLVCAAVMAQVVVAQAQDDRQRAARPANEPLFLPTASLMLNSDLRLHRKDYGRAEFSYNLGFDEVNSSALSIAVRLNPKREVFPKLPWDLEIVPIVFLVSYDSQVRQLESGAIKTKYGDSFGYLSGLFLTLVKEFSWYGFLVGIGQVNFDGNVRYGDPALSNGVVTRLSADAVAAGLLLFPHLQIQNVSFSFVYLYANNSNYEIEGNRASLDLTLKY